MKVQVRSVASNFKLCASIWLEVSTKCIVQKTWVNQCSSLEKNLKH